MAVLIKNNIDLLKYFVLELILTITINVKVYLHTGYFNPSERHDRALR